MNVKHKIQKSLWKFGYDFSRFTPRTHPLARRKQILDSFEIDTVLDIGANVGQFAEQTRKDIGYTNRIISFEPLSSAYKVLKEKAKKDPNWETLNYALGDTEGRQEINVAKNSYSSSLLDMLPSHVKSAPDSKYISKELIEVKRLDSVFGDLCRPTGRIYMKIDTQGFESQVLSGAKKSLMYIDTVQMEMSLIPMYQGDLLFDEKLKLMRTKGYELIAIETGFTDEVTGQIFQVDGLFHRF